MVVRAGRSDWDLRFLLTMRSGSPMRSSQRASRQCRSLVWQPNTQYNGSGAQVGRLSLEARLPRQESGRVTSLRRSAGSKISGPGELLSAIRANQPRQAITLTVTGPNGGGTVTSPVTLGSRSE